MSGTDPRQVRNDTKAILDRIDAGEAVMITHVGRRVALPPRRQRVRWLPRDEFVRALAEREADSNLAHDLREIAGENDGGPSG